MARSYSVSFDIRGALDGSLLAALRAASNAMRGLGNSARAASAAAKASQAGLKGMANSLNALQQAAQKFRELKRATTETQAALTAAQKDANTLAAKYRQDAQAAEQLRQKMSQLQGQLNQTKQLKLTQTDGVRRAVADLRALRQAYAEAKKAGDRVRMSVLAGQINQSQAALARQRQALKETAQAYKELSAAVKQTGTDLKAAEQAASQSGRGFEGAKSKAAELKSRLQEQQAALQRLRTQLGAAGFNTSNFAASEARLVSEINRVNAALERQQQLLQAQSRSQQASQEMFNAYNNFQSALQTAEQITSPFKSSLDKAIEFERVMSEVKALTQMDNIKAGNFARVNREMAALEKQALDLGAATIYTSQQVGEAQAYIARTGWNTEQILGATPIFLKLAASQHMDIARTADIATNIMTAFGHNMAAVGNDANKFAQMIQHDADVFAYTVTHSNQTFEQFGEAMKYAAPVAKNFGATIEEAAMMTKFMGDAGIQGSMAGTSMRQTMLRLIAPPKKATKAMEQYGITLDDANAAWQNANAVAQEYGVTLDETLTPGRQFINVMRQIDKNMAGASDREKLAALSAITGINAVSGAANLFGAGAEQAQNFTELLEKCEGALNQTYGVMTDNTYGATKSLESAWEAVQLAVGRGLLKIATSAANFLAPALISISEFINANPGVVQAAAAIAAALAGIVVGAAAVKLAFAGWKFVASSIALVGEALGALGSGALLGGLIGRLAALRTAMFGLGGAATLGGWGAMFGAISTQAAAAATAVRGFFASLALGSMASGVVGAIKAIGVAIAGAARAAMSFAFSPVGVALMALALAGLYCYQNWDRVGPVLSNIAGIIGGALAGAIRTVLASFAAMSANGTFDALCASASQLASIVGGALVKAFAVFLTVAASAIAIVLQLIGDVIKTIAELGGGIADALGKASQGDFSGAVEALGNTATKTLNNIKALGSHVWDGVEQGAKNVQQTLDMLDMAKLPTKAATARHAVHFDESGAAHEAPTSVAAETPAIDTAPTQAALDAVGDSAQNAATNMDGINQASQNLSQAGVDVQGLSTNAQAAGLNVQTMGTNAQTAGTNVQTLGSNSQTAAPNVQALGTSAGGAHANVSALGVAAGGAVGNIDAMSSAASAVATALSAKAVEIGSIKISVPQISVAAAPAAAAPAANYAGGIYRKGAFLTTFAERSPEAAIPLDNSTRARDLWTQAGEILGMLPRTEPLNFEPRLTTPPFVGDITLPKGAEIPARRQANRRYGERRPRPQTPQIPRLEDIATQLQPRRYDALQGLDLGRLNLGGLVGDIAGRIISPRVELPQIPSANDGGIIGRLLDRVLPRREPAQAAPTINLTVNVTIQGNADEAAVRRGIETALPAVEDWSRKLADYQHERRRRSYA